MARTLTVATLGMATTPRHRRRDWSGLIAHGILVAAVVVLAFPLYYAFVISTQSLGEVSSLPPKLYPSMSLLDNYVQAWERARMGRMLFNSAVMAVAIAVSQPPMLTVTVVGSTLLVAPPVMVMFSVSVPWVTVVVPVSRMSSWRSTSRIAGVR